MFKHSFKFDCLIALLLVSLTACVTETETGSASVQTVKQSSVNGIVTRERSIDWDRANEDASQSGAQVSSRANNSNSAVPVLLPQSTVDVSDSVAQVIFATPTILSDNKGYSAVIKSKRFDMLIDASNQMMLTDGTDLSQFPQDFDGEYQRMAMGGQLTIGRYGALYAIQFICNNNTQGNCIAEQTAREIVQSLQVQLP